MKFTGSLPGVRFDVAATRAALDQAAKQAIRGALQEFLIAALAPIPNWSGASRATFNALANQVGVNTEASGGGVSAGEADSTGSVVLGDNGIYSFTYTTSLTWLTWNEFHDANEDPDSGKWPPPAMLHSPGPYGSQMLGMAAALNFLADYDFFPGVTITSNPIKVG